MNINKYKIIRLDEKYIKNIELIWLNSLPENLKSMIGGVIVKNYLIEFLSDKSNLGIGVLHANELAGFVLFGTDDNIIKKIFINDFFVIIKSFLISLLFFDLKKIKNFIDCAIYLFLSKKKENILKVKDTQLLIICVNIKFQNKGLGSFMIKESFKNYDFFFKKYNNVFVKTLKKDAKNISFYKKNDFKYLFEIFGRVYLKY